MHNPGLWAALPSLLLAHVPDSAGRLQAGTLSRVEPRSPSADPASWPRSLAGNTLPGLWARAPSSVPHRDERCLRVVAVAAGGKAPATPATQSGLDPRAPVSDRDHQRLPTASARRAAQTAMSRPSARSATDTGPDPWRAGSAPAPHCPALHPAPLALGPASLRPRAPASFRRSAGGSPGRGHLTVE